MIKIKQFLKLDFFILLIAIGIFIAIIVLATQNDNSSKPNFTVFNSEFMGCSLFYDTLEQLEYPVKIGYKEIKEGNSIENVEIVVMPDSKYFDSLHRRNAMEWVFSGGNLILFEQYASEYSLEVQMANTLIFEDEFLAYYSYGAGTILFGDPSIIINSAVLLNDYPAVEIAAVIYNNNPKNVIFNEYYHGFNTEKSFWRDMPIYYRIMIFQIAIYLIVKWANLGKTFGRREPYYEEEERTENEFLKSLANVYKRAKIPIDKGEGN